MDIENLEKIINELEDLPEVVNAGLEKIFDDFLITVSIEDNETDGIIRIIISDNIALLHPYLSYIPTRITFRTIKKFNSVLRRIINILKKHNIKVDNEHLFI